MPESPGHSTQDDGGRAETDNEERRKEDGASNGGKRFPARSSGGTNAKKSAEGPGLAPSDEMKLLREAREVAQAAAAASGSGRRARVPSRKLLEASGALEAGESAQWMTKEKKEEDARITRELKEQRKAAAAVGLKVGQVIETIVPVLRGVGNRSQGSFGAASVRGGGSAASKASWRKLTPAELREAAKRPGPRGAARGTSKRNNATASAVSKVLTVTNERERKTSATAVADGSLSERNRNGLAVTSAAERGAARNRPSTGEVATASGPKRSRDDRDEHSTQGASKRRKSEELGERQASAPKVTCELASCSRTAKFGVNGVVRYW